MKSKVKIDPNAGLSYKRCSECDVLITVAHWYEKQCPFCLKGMLPERWKK